MPEPKLLNVLKMDSRVKSIEPLAESESSKYTLTLNKGFIDGESAMHIIMARTLGGLKSRMKYVEPCACVQCQKENS